MFLIYHKPSKVIIRPEYRSYFESVQECHDAMREQGIGEDSYDVCPTVDYQDF